MRARRAGLLLAITAVAVMIAGCETTQEKSARLAAKAKKAVLETGTKVTKRNPAVKVVRTAVVHDKYGTAAVVELRSSAKSVQASLPVSITVSERGDGPAFTNDAAGLAESLNHVPLVRPGERAYWVNDQVRAEKPRNVQAKIGLPEDRAPEQAPRMVVSKLKQAVDPDGVVTSGKVRNTSRVTQRNLTLFAVALVGTRVVAAGRAGIETVKPGKSARFKVFWIGKPNRARIRIFAPPSVLQEEK
ncbi:MAG: hypothetical protein H0V22_00460 [Solirubrobacterales bacterium]|jgi:hypothetical protein|nr:hypothetical protein [Solirubrobacterales bacterium]